MILDDRAVDTVKPLRSAASEDRADRKDEEDRWEDRDRQCPQHDFLQFVGLPQASSQQHHAAVRPPSGDEDRRLRSARIGQSLRANDMRASVDRDCGHRRDVAEELGPACVEEGDIVQATDVPGQAQFQRLTQTRLTVVRALGGLVDEDGADPLHVCARNLKVDEPEGGGGRHGDRKTERERETKSPRFEDLNRQHSV